MPNRANQAALLAKCDELLDFLAAHDGHLKLRRLAADIEALRDRVRAELAESGEASSDPCEVEPRRPRA